MKNLCSKTRKPENAYEVWESKQGLWTWFVLKKYQSPEAEAKNSFARWHCMVKSPMTPNGEYGDCYVAEIKKSAVKLDNNPLSHKLVSTSGDDDK